MIDHKNKVIFIHLPRTGGSILEKQITGQNQGKINMWHKHLNQSMAMKIYKNHWNKYKKITIVRNPFDWLVSYLMFDVAKLWPWGKFNFDLCLDRVIDFNSLSAVPSYGWMAQHCKFFDIFNPRDIDCIMKYEDAIKGKDISPYNQLPDVKPIEIPDAIEGQKTKRKKRYQEYYTPKTRNKVRQFFAEELKYFNYKFD